MSKTKKETYSSSKKPVSPEVHAENIPQALRNEPRWLAWDFVRRKGKWCKVPKDARTGGPGKCNDTNTWCDFETAYAAYKAGRFDGIGFALGDGWVGVDLDDCLVDGEFTPFAREIIDELDTYTEISPSRTGVKMVLKADLPEGHSTKNADGTLEVYSTGRYFCITGLIENDNQVEQRQEAVQRVMQQHIGSQATKPRRKTSRRRKDDSDGVNKHALKAMLRIKPQEGESDSSNRLFAVACRAKEFDLSEKSFLETIACYEMTYPFAKAWSPKEKLKRFQDAEQRVVVGSKLPIYITNSNLAGVIEQGVEALSRVDVYQNTDNVLMRYLPNPPRATAR